jgi:hypothetical protein
VDLLVTCCHKSAVVPGHGNGGTEAYVPTPAAEATRGAASLWGRTDLEPAMALHSAMHDSGARGEEEQVLPLLALQMLLEYGRAGSSTPPMTAALLAANMLIRLRPRGLHEILHSIARVSFNPQLNELIIKVLNVAYPVRSVIRRRISVRPSKSPIIFSNRTCELQLGYVLEKGIPKRSRDPSLVLKERCCCEHAAVPSWCRHRAGLHDGRHPAAS